MARQRQFRFCREGIYYLIVMLAVVIGATLRQLNLLILLGTFLAGPLAFSLIYGRLALRRFGIDRRLPPQLRADQPLAVEVNVSNRRRWLSIWSIEVEDLVTRQDAATNGAAKSDSPTKVGVFFPVVVARTTVRGTYQGRLPRRGRYRFGPLTVMTRFPLGLVRHSMTVDETQDLIVHPRVGRLTHDWTQVARQSAAGSHGLHRRGSLEADFYGLRDWRSGDNRRWIHWRTSARRGSLVVRQFDERRSRDLALLVDLWQPADPSDEHLENVEKAISFLATLISDGCHQQGRRLFLSLAGASYLERSGSASPRFFRQQMDELALLEPHQDPGFPPALGHALAVIPPSIPTLLVSTRPVDWEAFRNAAGQRNALVAGRNLQSVDVTGDALSRYFRL